MVTAITICQVVKVDKHNKQHLLQVNNRYFWEQSGSSFFCAGISLTSEKLDWAWQQQNLTLWPWWHHYNRYHNMPSNCDQQTQQAAPFASKWLLFLITEPHMSFSVHEGTSDFYAKNVNNNNMWAAHHFLWRNVNIWLFLMCDTPLWSPLSRQLCEYGLFCTLG